MGFIMLKIKAEIMFTIPNQSYSGRQYPLRPTFNFGKGFLFSGTIKSAYNEYLYGQIYFVDVEFPTIECEAYDCIQHLVKIGMNLVIQIGLRIIGTAKLIDFVYERL